MTSGLPAAEDEVEVGMYSGAFDCASAGCTSRRRGGTRRKSSTGCTDSVTGSECMYYTDET